MVTVEDIISNDVLDRAYAWLCKRRKDYPPSSDIWEFRRMWQQEKTRLCNELMGGKYQVSLLSRVNLKNHEEEIDLWTSRDALELISKPPLACHPKMKGGKNLGFRPFTTLRQI